MKSIIFNLRKFCYLLLFFIDSKLGIKNQLFILSYHSINQEKNFFSVSRSDFEYQIRQVASNYKPITLSELNEFLKSKKKIKKPSFILTFDDGYKDIMSVQGLFSELGIKPAVFVLSDEEQINRDVMGNNYEILSLSDIKTLITWGWEIGYHSASHSSLLDQSTSDLQREIFISKQKLETKLLQKIRFFAYPNGKYSDTVINQVKSSGYNLALTMDDSLLTTSTNSFKIPRIGINGTHSPLEFQALASPSVICFRRLMKATFSSLYEKVCAEQKPSVLVATLARKLEVSL